MSYPVILYPKLIVEFCREHPLPSRGEESAASVSPASSDDPSRARRAIARSDSRRSVSSPTIPASLNSLSWFIYSGLALGVLGFNLFVTPRLPSDWQQPVRLASIAGATVAITFQLRRDIDTLATLSRELPLNFHELAVAPPTLSETPHSSYERQHVIKQRLIDYLQELKVNLSGQVLQPIGASDAPVGRSEDAFASVLELYFPGRVKRQLEFPIPQSEKGRSFSTDFAVVLDELGLYIDVEIDEPFDLKKKRPTHCIDDYHDRYRNGFFLQGNWIVIRFAEEQIVRYPKSCCREIARVIERVTGLDRFLKPLACEPILRPTPQWTKKEARRMAKSNYRDTYLSLLSNCST